ncbi:MAG: cysteine desulfurase [Clostridia bacterium]|nr:cysteine desulfurase [Clostridia bacterium]
MIYLDNAATTSPDEEALARATQFYCESYFNPSASYGGGFAVHTALEEARKKILSTLADPSKFELIFTSSGTEADNHAIFSGARRGNAVTTAGEHAAVERSFNELKARGVEPRYAPLHKDGSVNIEKLLSLVDEKTALVSAVHVSNETGAVNDIFTIAREVKRKNPRTLFHADGVQAFGKLQVKLAPEIDLYSVSAHKIGGIKGVGALFKRKSIALSPLIHGGGQESALRSGTENVLGILDFAYAAERRFAVLKENGARVAALKAQFCKNLNENFTILSPENGSPYVLTLSVEGARGEVLQRMLWDMGVCVGTGSACSSKNRHSRVLKACGYGEKVLDGVLRVSFSPESTMEECVKAAQIMNTVAGKFLHLTN